MAWTTHQVLIAVVMVITGTINTLSTKWADLEHSVGRDNGAARPFNHPFVQACGMFIGELICLLVFKALVLTVWRSYMRDNNAYQQAAENDGVRVYSQRQFNPLVFWPAALCDMLSTSLMYVGLNLTYASSFQMLRGAVIVFTALLSVAFLQQRMRGFHWLGIVLIIAGLTVVGASDVLFNQEKHADTNGIIAGDLLIVLAQIISAMQMVYEQKFVKGMPVHPLQAVGWEGLFGFITLSLVCIPLSYIYVGDFTNNPSHTLEDPIDAFVQLRNSKWLVAATIANIVSIAFFNFAGISVTKAMGATSRMVLDSLRTVFIWGIGLAVGWQAFAWLQLPGFLLLLLGMAIYNEVLLGPFLYRRCGIKFFEPAAEVLPSDDDDEEAVGILPAAYPPPAARNSAAARDDDGEGTDEDVPILTRRRPPQ